MMANRGGKRRTIERILARSGPRPPAGSLREPPLQISWQKQARGVRGSDITVSSIPLCSAGPHVPSMTWRL